MERIKHIDFNVQIVTAFPLVGLEGTTKYTEGHHNLIVQGEVIIK